ncbi:MAG: GGDEF domain-containing protein [Desulfobacterales bacterium]|nr:GGDEF domain-containing protein [Desulfobacterales bacterium]
MKKSKLQEKIEANGFVIISTAIALLYWYIDTLQLGPIVTRLITCSLFISYGLSSQYITNSVKQLMAKVLSLSITDPLTGLYNRRGFTTLAGQQLKIEKRTKESLFLLFADIDDLKSINDNLGHAKGDDAIIQVANILKEVFRESDVIARIGGDEFVVFGLGVETENSDTIENRLQQQFDPYNNKANQGFKISISIGVVYIDSDNSLSIDELISKADVLMYGRKKHKKSTMS